MGVLLACLSVYYRFEEPMKDRQRTAKVPVGIELQTVGSCHIDTRNHT